LLPAATSKSRAISPSMIRSPAWGSPGWDDW
jgi:hypothetical protein